MKKIYYIALSTMLISAACSSPAKKQHEDRQRNINDLQNVGAGASKEDENKPAGGALTDSTRMDTTGNIDKRN
ncbi:hypothetical protein KHS38_01415 [Mucilaginibacter sp. Bleaf8]|uniref:hypothetical protein n=1 Tax=Mucilaginibacter sp. Bleaf8 TaxID=2834430 RepID=UPI001BCBAF8F|nr:hypothetical protein [Mucilaginibacter sp. Bleaf8]MBS7563049.1 hypothetical protein [Mucilaginibacter sp. Bleaf8]